MIYCTREIDVLTVNVCGVYKRDLCSYMYMCCTREIYVHICGWNVPGTNCCARVLFWIQKINLGTSGARSKYFIWSIGLHGLPNTRDLGKVQNQRHLSVVNRRRDPRPVVKNQCFVPVADTGTGARDRATKRNNVQLCMLSFGMCKEYTPNQWWEKLQL